MPPHESGKSERKLVGFNNFVRNNPYSDKFQVNRFHHVEFWCADATTSYKRFIHGLGMNLIAKSDSTTGNKKYASFALQSNEMCMIFTSAYNNKSADMSQHHQPHPGYDTDTANRFVIDHGLAVRAIGVHVDNAKEAHDISVKNGALSVLAPQELKDKKTGEVMWISEIKSVGDVVIRWLSGKCKNGVIPNYEEVPVEHDNSYGLVRMDHIVSNVPNLFDTVDYIMNATGFHEFSEFTAEDVGTVDSGLNSMVLANNNEYVLMPVNEPTFGTPRKSQIQTYIEHNNGAGVQHIALKTMDIFHTMTQMRKMAEFGAGFEFMPKPNSEYYQKIPERLAKGGNKHQLSAKEIAECEKLGILADADEKGVLLQIFTKPIGDRPTIFFEIIQRIGCMREEEEQKEQKRQRVETALDDLQSAGCGGFGKGNFTELFKSIERFEIQNKL